VQADSSGGVLVAKWFPLQQFPGFRFRPRSDRPERVEERILQRNGPVLYRWLPGCGRSPGPDRCRARSIRCLAARARDRGWRPRFREPIVCGRRSSIRWSSAAATRDPDPLGQDAEQLIGARGIRPVLSWTELRRPMHLPVSLSAGRQDVDGRSPSCSRRHGSRSLRTGRCSRPRSEQVGRAPRFP